MCRRRQWNPLDASMLAPMTTTCAYCNHPATATIVASPQQVCFEHLLEFWTGLLGYARDHSEPCVKNETACTCRSCEEQLASELRAFAIRSVGPSPGDHESFPMRLAS
jgi:hypothetical protein